MIYFFLRIWDLPPSTPPPPSPHYSMGHLSLQYGTSLITVWDISHYSMVHLSLQYGTYLITLWESIYTVWGHLYIQHGTYLITLWEYIYTVWGHLYIQHGTYLYTVWDIYLYSMGHLSLQYGTSLITVWDILSIQYGTYIYAVWDIYLYSMGHLSYIVWDIYISSMGHLPIWYVTSIFTCRGGCGGEGGIHWESEKGGLWYLRGWELRSGSEGGRLVYSRLVGEWMGWGCGRMGIGIGGFWTGKMRSHCGMEGGGEGMWYR